ncbi:MAG: DUF4097 family beta strand repeat-containing protein [Acidobacteria bacterium]|nr:DUF4097 family beta strand repeat-containing protein [Acidobacteriota bacterium]
MKFRIFIVILLVAAAAVAGRQVSRMRNAGTNADGSTRDEIRRSFRLARSARVEVRHINGSVEIETAESETAEVLVVTTADSPEDLASRRVIIEDSPDSLVVRSERGTGGGWWRRLWGGGGQVRQQLKLTIPRGASLAVRHVNGPVAVGEMEAVVEVGQVNGRVEVARVSGRTEVSHVNGGVKLGLAQLDEQGMEVNHVNGNVEIRLKESLNADIAVSSHNGGFALNAPNVTTQERENRSTFRARLGSGGPEINLRGVNGNVRFESSETRSAPPKPDAPDAGNLEPPPLPPPPPTFR